MLKAIYKIMTFKDYGVGDKLPKGLKFGELLSRDAYLIRQYIKILNSIKPNSIEIIKIDIDKQ